jgi:hypothetical protein
MRMHAASDASTYQAARRWNVLRVPWRCQGQALLILILMMGVGSMLLVYGSTTALGRAVKAESYTRGVLDQAKQALIGRAVADANRPGSLPCPDTDDDGSAELFVGSSCPSYIGRLPWRTLGIGDLRDAAGERLWYALSPNFRDHPTAPAINSDTTGTLTVYSSSDATTITSQAIAVVFAPGLAVPGQRRDNVATLCNAPAKTVARTQCAANYVDSAANVANATAAGPYIVATETEFFNDKLAVIVAADVMPLVEQRVALELRNALLAYRASSACRCYPWADSGNDGVSDSGANRGRIPATSALPQNWPTGALPSYFAANKWARVIHYAVGRRALENDGSGCTTCLEDTLSLDDRGGYDVILITPGYAVATRSSSDWRDYVDDVENRNGDDRYSTPLAPKADRDHIYAIAGATSGCAVNARVLTDNLPCGMPGNTVRSVCQSAATALSSCSCAAAGAMLTKTPCTDQLSTRECNSALNQLKTCGL